jgi:hypothetical protein
MLRTITVAELRAALECCEDDDLVIVSADYGDYSHTQQALPLKGELEPCEIRESGYSNSGYAVSDGDPDDEPVYAKSGGTYLLLS